MLYNIHVNFHEDLFSINNIVVPKRQVVNTIYTLPRKEKQTIVSNETQKELFKLDNIVVSDQKLKITRKFFLIFFLIMI